MVLPGDILVTRSKRGFGAWVIRAFTGRGTAWNHVIVASHTDAAGTFWGVEAQPGGVGWVDLKRYLGDPWTLTNAEQPRNETDRYLIVKAAEGLLGKNYDWAAILGDAAEALCPTLDRYWHRDWDTLATPPVQVICSTLAQWVYRHLHLPAPAEDRECSPADWADFIVRKGWLG